MSFLKGIKDACKSWVQANLVMLLVITGVAGIIFCSVFYKSINALNFTSLDFDISRILINISSATLGAGVFAAVMKSAQFTSIFQQHIFDVFYRPQLAFGLEPLIAKWLNLTNFILKSNLPENYKDAADKIWEQFINGDIHYHFESFEAKYNIEIDDNGIATVTHTIKTKITVSPNKKDPVIEQKINVDGSCTLLSLSVDNKPVEFENLLVPNEKNPSERLFKLELSKFLPEGTKEKTISLNRTYKFSQNLHKEPYIVATFARYLRGCLVKTKVPAGYKMYFKTTGFSSEGFNDSFTDGESFTNWRLAGPSDLLLPGQGYIILINPNKE